MKKPLPPLIIHGGFVLLLAIVLFTGWWLAGDGAQGSAVSADLPRLATNKGPIEPAFCAPSLVPREPPPMDSPFGFHLYAQRAKGVIYALPAMIIADQLAPPENPAAEKQPSARPPAIGNGPKNETAYDDVQSVINLLQEFRRSFGAMPVGELNDEIVRRLQGENPQGIALLPKTHPSINSDGELVDRWGTPYRFHPESSWHMTIRSAGPDRKMWTADDILSEQEPNLLQL
ncbi:MAG TPA: hypothetical protein VD994_13675 [Prosthecobacter sp.]|nr:hypothetical protein [Prosthecobacter sp.]